MALFPGKSPCCMRWVTIDTATGKVSKESVGKESSDMSKDDADRAQGNYKYNPDQWSDWGNPPRGGQNSNGLVHRPAIFCGKRLQHWVPNPPPSPPL